ncbi:MAG: hypothetical protein ACR2JE_18315, partial [Acidobacteriaceae bacterium]
MYTMPPNTGAISDPNEQDRTQFQGLLSSYYGTRDAAVLQLTNYVFALSAAFWMELATQAATQALVAFPVNPNAPSPPPPIPTLSEAQVIFSGALGLDVSAAYFYALNYNISASASQDSLQQKQNRQQVIYGADQQANLNQLTTSINAGLIALQPLNPAQAVRILEALNIPATSTAPVWPIAAVSPTPMFVVGWQVFETGWGVGEPGWLGFPTNATWASYQEGDDLAGFWQPLAAAQPIAFLDIVLWALTQGFMVGPNPLAQLIETNLPLANLAALEATTPADWQNFFTANPAWLPSFTQPGTVAAQIAAFIQWVQQFFQLAVPAFVPPVPAPSIPPRYGVPTFDLAALTIADYPGFFLGMAINFGVLEAAAAAAIPHDEAAQAWAVQAVETLNELYILSQIPAAPEALDFSIMEALFARGFTSREMVQDLTFNDFQQALTGTVAYVHAVAIYANAGPPHPVLPPGGGPFVPINPGGLTDCIPPPWHSPLGPVAYLHEMLTVSERSTCDRPYAPPAPGHTTLQVAIDGRRGPVETLAVTRANLETPLPLIDIVNECLQLVASKTPPVPPGAVYNTSEHHLGPYKLCDGHCDDGDLHHDCACVHDDCDCHGEHHDEHHEDECHEPAAIFAALPEYSTPAAPVAANSLVEPAVWNKLKLDFSACCLPYDQALDVNRTYLDHFRSCRFEEMRTFRRCIHEFMIDAPGEPSDFQTHLWRYPVRLDIAIEYLGLSPEEYATLFDGVLPYPCGARRRRPRRMKGSSPDACLRKAVSRRGVICLPDFLKCTCLTYCEFLDLWRCGFVPFDNDRDRRGFPECEPCCLDDLCLRFPGEDPGAALLKIAVFIRLWQKLRHHCGAGYTFAELADICDVLDFPGPDFIRQLAAFQMLRDQFRLKLTGGEKPAAGATGADRTFLLSLWTGPAARHWPWALRQLLDGVAKHAECHYECKRQGPELVKLLEDNFEPLSRLVGFDPAVAAYRWHATPTNTLRFAEVLAKIYASDFSVGEVLYLFNANRHLDGDDPFPEQGADDADDEPFELPEEAHRHSLWELRHKLLRVHPDEADIDRWTWQTLASALVHEFNYDAIEVNRLGEHFFAPMMGQQARRFATHLAPTSAAMWNAPPHGPFQYDPAAGSLELWAKVPIADHAVLAQLSRISLLSPAERAAVQDVYFQPRRLLAHFAMLFDDFTEAQRRLIEDDDAEARWYWFRRQYTRARERCRVIATHLQEHVDAATSQRHPDGINAAHLVLRQLFADENASTAPPPSWENDDGTLPPVTWAPPANGGA